MWEAGRLLSGGVWYRVERPEFRAALRQVCDRQLRGLTNHNYLRKVLIPAARETSRRGERELREREQEMMAGRDGSSHPDGRTRGSAPTTGEGTRGPLGDLAAQLAGLPDDPAWRQETSRLSKGVRQAQTPEEKEDAEKALARHLAAAAQSGLGAQEDG